MGYAELLKSPKWQKKRLFILNRDNFTCQICGSTDKMLHVHHKYYTNYDEPWEILDSGLVTLCDKCHERIPEFKENMNDEIKQFNELIYNIGAITPDDIREIYTRLFDLVATHKLTYSQLDEMLCELILLKQKSNE